MQKFSSALGGLAALGTVTVANAETGPTQIEVVDPMQARVEEAQAVLTDTVQAFGDLMNPILSRLNEEREANDLASFKLEDFVTDPDNHCWDDALIEAVGESGAEACEEKVKDIQLAALDVQIAQVESRVAEKEGVLETSQAEDERLARIEDNQEQTIDEVQSEIAAMLAALEGIRATEE